MMQVALAQSGVFLSDGATNVLPIPPDVHRGVEAALTTTSATRSMNGFYQGWDLHPAQLPTRYAAVYAFFLSARPAATARLRDFVDKAAQATLVGDVFDDAATGQGLLNFFVRGLSSGALTMAGSRGDRPDGRGTAGPIVCEDPRGAQAAADSIEWRGRGFAATEEASCPFATA